MGGSKEYYVMYTDWSYNSDIATGILTRKRMQRDGKEKMIEVIEWAEKDLSALRSGPITSNGSMWREFYGILLLADYFGRIFHVNCLVTDTSNAAMRALLDAHGRCLLCWLRGATSTWQMPTELAAYVGSLSVTPAAPDGGTARRRQRSLDKSKVPDKST